MYDCGCILGGKVAAISPMTLRWPQRKLCGGPGYRKSYKSRHDPYKQQSGSAYQRCKSRPCPIHLVEELECSRRCHSRQRCDEHGNGPVVCHGVLETQRCRSNGSTICQKLMCTMKLFASKSSRTRERQTQAKFNTNNRQRPDAMDSTRLEYGITVGCWRYPRRRAKLKPLAISTNTRL